MSSIRKAALAGLATLATLTLATATAAAATSGLEYTAHFSGPIASFLNPSGVDVNQANGDVYVTEGEYIASGGSQTVDVLNSEGVLQTTLKDKSTEYLRLHSVAASTATGKIYVAEDGYGKVILFNAAGVMEAEWEGLQTPQGSFDRHYGVNVEVAVDNSTSHADASAGDVYVLNTDEGFVDKFGHTGTGEEYLSQIDGAETPAGPFSEGSIDGIAIDATGDVYVSDSANHVVDVFSPEGKYLRQLTGIGSPGSIAVNGADGDVYVLDTATGLVDVFNSTGEPQGALTGTQGGFFTEPRGLAIDEATGTAYVLDGGPKAVDVYGPASLPLPAAPGTETPSADTGTSVTLDGSLNPGGVGTSYFFSYNESATSPRGNQDPDHGRGVGQQPRPHGSSDPGGTRYPVHRLCLRARRRDGARRFARHVHHDSLEAECRSDGCHPDAGGHDPGTRDQREQADHHVRDRIRPDRSLRYERILRTRRARRGL